MTKEELQKIIAIDEGFRIELTTSTGKRHAWLRKEGLSANWRI